MTDAVETPVKKKIGRPKGARGKSALAKAQLAIDELAGTAVETLKALMENDKDFLDCESDVPATIRLNACKEILVRAIANEKEKLDDKPKSGSPAAILPSIPQVFAKAKAADK